MKFVPGGLIGNISVLMKNILLLVFGSVGLWASGPIEKICLFTNPQRVEE